MKKTFLLLFMALIVSMITSAQVTVCDVSPDENGHFNTPFIKSGTVTWDAASRTLTLNNAVVEHSSETPYDYVYPIRITEDATIVIKGECRLTTTGFVALGFEGSNSKNVTIQGDGSLYANSIMRGIFLRCTRLTIKDIKLQAKGIMNNGDGVLCALAFDNVQADINGAVERIGEHITIQNCAITYPKDAYIEHSDYGYYIAQGNGNPATHIIISRNVDSIIGDVNGDQEVNIADINIVINVILGGSSNYMAADVNGDHEVNIADVNLIINIILGGSAPTPGHDYVDLGLPSGTLWATCNVGAKNPEEYGDYFAWGETETKEIYYWRTYKWCQGDWTTLTKYCFQNYYGTVDDKAELEPSDDAARVKWGPSWQIPTMAQQDELRECCTWLWTTRNGVNGYQGTGPNGNTLFLPAAGYIDGNRPISEGSFGFYWSNSVVLGFSIYAYSQDFFSGSIPGLDNHDRSLGMPIRAVRVSKN